MAKYYGPALHANLSRILPTANSLTLSRLHVVCPGPISDIAIIGCLLRCRMTSAKVRTPPAPPRIEPTSSPSASASAATEALFFPARLSNADVLWGADHVVYTKMHGLPLNCTLGQSRTELEISVKLLLPTCIFEEE